MQKSILNCLLLSFFSICILVPPLGFAQNSFNKYNSYLKSNNQVILVTAASWIATQGTMQLCERANNRHNWKLIRHFPVTLGRNGMAFDKRTILPKPLSALIKHEGDGKSPSGIFTLGPVFSYHSLAGLKMPFKKADTADICVDDIHSAFYNTWVNTDTATQKDWNSFEHMKSSDDSYEYGVWVKYNSDKIFAGDGSCIFLHVWGGSTAPTAGCTAMEKENMLAVIHWLDESKHPVLLQVVEEK